MSLIVIWKLIKFPNDGDWRLGIGDWGLGIGPIPNPQSPIPNSFIDYIKK